MTEIWCDVVTSVYPYRRWVGMAKGFYRLFDTSDGSDTIDITRFGSSNGAPD